MKKIIVIAIVVLVAILGVCLVSSTGRTTNNRTLVAYFSATGNTAAVAERLATATGADLFEIKPVAPYTAEDLDWHNDKSRSSTEMADRGSRPEIASRVENMEQYDLVFVGFPIWWGREPSVVDTFLESYDFAGKTIVPFATSGSTPSTEGADENIRQIVAVSGTSVPAGKRFPNDVSADELKSWASEWLK